MKLSLSNIAIADGYEHEIYVQLQALGFTGLEIAPTKLLGAEPYNKLEAAKTEAAALYNLYGLTIPSMQSIWYGQSGNIFVEAEAERLLNYTFKAADFACAVACKSMVFGCPKNRNIPSGKTAADAFGFFKAAAQYAHENNTALALEANVPEYGTNFINTTAEAFEFAKNIPELKVNYDLGTALSGGEGLQIVAENLPLISHIHISEPGLAPIQKRPEHTQLAALLRQSGYEGYVSIEMKAAPPQQLTAVLKYISEVFA